MPPLRLVCFCLLALGGAGLRPAAAAEPAAAPRPLVQAREVLGLSHAEAARHLPVTLTGTVTYCHFPHPGLWSLFVQDETGGVFVSGPGPRVAVGDRVIVHGITDAGEFSPKVHRTSIEVVGTAPLPAALPCAYEDLISGREDCQWIELRGIIRSARLQEGTSDQLLLEVASGGGRLTVHVLLDAARDFSRLVDAEVSVRGVCATLLNRRQQLLAAEIYTKGLAQITVLAPAPADPYELPRSPIGNLLQFSRSGRFGHRVKISARVTWRDPAGALYVRDDTGALLVQTRESSTLAPGDVVDVLGFPAVGSVSPYLQDAIFRRTGREAAPAARPVDAARRLDSRCDADLIAVEGRVLEMAQSSEEQILTLQSGDVVFKASLAGARPDRPLPDGTRVKLTGICVVLTESQRAVPNSFHLLLRSADDIAVLALPSWWTVARVARILGATAVAVVVALGWVVVLTRNNKLLREHRRIQQEILDISGREQRRIAQDLHDGVCQQLGAVAFLTKMLEEDLHGTQPAQADAARDISRHLSDAIAQTRTVAKGLFPVKLEENGLESALAELASHTSRLYKLACRFECNGAALLSDNEAARNLYYVAYEAVNNAIKHARPQAITIALRRTDDALVLEVENDGASFAPVAEARGMGLHIMRYRAEAIGATFDIGAGPTAGCRVTCRLPLPQPAAPYPVALA